MPRRPWVVALAGAMLAAAAFAARGRPGIDRIDADVSPTADIDGSERRQLQ